MPQQVCRYSSIDAMIDVDASFWPIAIDAQAAGYLTMFLRISAVPAARR